MARHCGLSIRLISSALTSRFRADTENRSVPTARTDTTSTSTWAENSANWCKYDPTPATGTGLLPLTEFWNIPRAQAAQACCSGVSQSRPETSFHGLPSGQIYDLGMLEFGFYRL